MATIGRCCVVPDDIEPAIVTKHVYRITPEKRLVLSRYLLLAFQAQSIVRYQMFRQVRGQTRPGLNGTIIKRLVVPVPPLEEQHQIFERLDEKMSSIEHLLPEFNNLDANIRQMRECILRKAFSGQLVPQDPNDETASELLERIKLETSSKVQSLPKSKRRKTGAQLDAK
jgi:type I restriction enzyme S subunit